MDAEERLQRIERLRHKISKADGKGKLEKASKYREELSDLLLEERNAAETEEETAEAAKVAKWQHKLGKAVRKGDKEKQHKYQARLRSVGALRDCDASTVDGSASSLPSTPVAVAPPKPAFKPRSFSVVDDEAGHEDGLRHDHKSGLYHRMPLVPSSEASKGPAINPATGLPYPPSAPAKGDVTLLLFYAYVKPHWTPKQRVGVIQHMTEVLSGEGVTGRLRVALEGFNATLTGPKAGIANFCQTLRDWDPSNFGSTDFKTVDGLADNKAFKNLKVWPVEELVTYGFDVAIAPLEMGGTHLKPSEWTEMSARSDAVIIDVRNANESAIGWFQPPDGGATLLDPRMRRSTEFPAWLDSHIDDLKDKQIMMYCTAGIRCERASALLGQKGLKNVFQLEGGVHRYLDAYPEDGGIWVGKNYTFDRRFSHGAANAQVVGRCACCHEPWERYQAQAKCAACKMETLLCRACERSGRAGKTRLLCWLCREAQSSKGATRAAAEKAAAAFAATGGGREGEGEGKGEYFEEDSTVGGSKRPRGGFSGGGRGGSAAKRGRY